MSELLDEALKVLRGLPDEMQDSAVRAIIESAATLEEHSPAF